MALERKYFTPGEGQVVPDPAVDFKPVPADGKWVLASTYWHRRVIEGSGTLSDSAPASAEPPEPRAPVATDRP